MNKILIFNNLKSQINFEDISLLDQVEPIHPYMGVEWTKILINFGLSVDYLNSKINSGNNFAKLIYNYCILPKKYSTIVVYSTNGLGIVTLLRIFNLRANIVFYSLSKINPDGNIFKVFLRKTLFYSDTIFSSHIVLGLNELSKYSFIKNKFYTYFPFYSDVNFFKEKVAHSYNLRYTTSKYILIVGDITRDDEYVFSELSQINIPVIRVSRDKRVINNLKPLIKKQRGDLILSGVSFSELASLYNNATLCITASKYDHWQPGGITSLAEALACGGICLCNSGGEIEKEFTFLSSLTSHKAPLFYFDYPRKDSLKNLVLKLLELKDVELNNIRVSAQLFSAKNLNMNINGLPKLNMLIKSRFR